MALGWQALEAQKTRKPLEQGGALEQVGARMKRVMGLTPWLTGAGARSAEGTDIGHENAEGMAYVGVRVEPTVRLGTEVEGGSRHESFDWDLRRTA